MVAFSVATQKPPSLPPRAPAQVRVGRFVAITCSVPNHSCDFYKADFPTHVQLVSSSRDPIGYFYVTVKKSQNYKLPTQYFFQANLWEFLGSNPTSRLDPTGNWFVIDDIFTGPVDEIIVIGIVLPWVINEVVEVAADVTTEVAEAIDYIADDIREDSERRKARCWCQCSTPNNFPQPFDEPIDTSIPFRYSRLGCYNIGCVCVGEAPPAG